MSQALVPCPSCVRHVRSSEEVCPFCRSALPRALVPAVVADSSERMSRAAVIVFAASVAITGCNTAKAPADTHQMTMPAYGAPPPPPEEPPHTTSPDAGLAERSIPVPAYGVSPPPPVDAGKALKRH